MYGATTIQSTRGYGRSASSEPKTEHAGPAGTEDVRRVQESKAEIPFVSIITTCKGRLEHLRQTLPKMLAQQYSSRFEVIVVDYDCPDETYRWCVELKDRRLIGARVLTDAENFNLSRANKRGE